MVSIRGVSFLVAGELRRLIEIYRGISLVEPGRLADSVVKLPISIRSLTRSFLLPSSFLFFSFYCGKRSFYEEHYTRLLQLDAFELIAT